MTTYWTAPAFLDEMQSRLENEIGDVTVYTASVNTLKAKDNIVFTGIVGEQEYASLGGGSRDDSYTVETSVFVARGGSDDATAKQARDRATEIVTGIVEVLVALGSPGPDNAALREAIGATQVLPFGIARLNVAQGREQKSRWCQVDLDIRVKARI